MCVRVCACACVPRRPLRPDKSPVMVSRGEFLKTLINVGNRIKENVSNTEDDGCGAARRTQTPLTEPPAESRQVVPGWTAGTVQVDVKHVKDGRTPVLGAAWLQTCSHIRQVETCRHTSEVRGHSVGGAAYPQQLQTSATDISYRHQLQTSATNSCRGWISSAVVRRPQLRRVHDNRVCNSCARENIVFIFFNP